MEIKKIAVAIDGSDATEKIIEMAKLVAKEHSLKDMVVVNVLAGDIPTGARTVELPADTIGLLEKNGRDILDAAVAELGNLDSPAETELLRGEDVAHTLVTYLKNNDFDMVIMGSRGFSGVRGYIGSVSRKVLINANCPVLIVK